MPAVQRSPALQGFDGNLQAIDAPAVEGNLISDEEREKPATPLHEDFPSTRSRSRLLAHPGPRSLSRSAPLSRTRPTRFRSSPSPVRDNVVEPLKARQKLTFKSVQHSPRFDLSKAPNLNLSPTTPNSAELSNRKDSGNTTISTQFDVSVLGLADDEDPLEPVPLTDEDDTETLVPSSNEVSDVETEYPISPVTKEIIEFIQDMPNYLTPEMEQAAQIRVHCRNLRFAISTWEDEFKDLNVTEIPVDELKLTIQTAKELKDKILQSQLACEDVDELQAVRDAAGLARTGFI